MRFWLRRTGWLWVLRWVTFMTSSAAAHDVWITTVLEGTTFRALQHLVLDKYPSSG